MRLAQAITQYIMMKIDVKWGKNNYLVQVDTSLPPTALKAQLFSLTGVPPDRQKITVKGGMLKDDAPWTSTGLKDGSKVMMLGTADAVPEAPKEEIKWLEDLPESHQQSLDLRKYGIGLNNLGNTCYMNATLQCLYATKELRTALTHYQDTNNTTNTTNSVDGTHKLMIAARDLFQDMASQGEAVTPFKFLAALHAKFPQFAEKSNGMLMQQDAEECWTQLVYAMKDKLTRSSGDASHEKSGASAACAIHDLYGITLSSTLTCTESGETLHEEQHNFMLKCNIDQTTGSLMDGLLLGLKQDREQNSPVLGRMANWVGSSLISKLPRYLTIQQVRFYYKKEIKQKAKLLKSVPFPIMLDTYTLCSEELKKELNVGRNAMQARRDAEVGLGAAGAASKKARTDETTTIMEVDAPTTTTTATATTATTSEVPVGAMTGRYSLQAVLTHKGRSADSGHYVAWVKGEDGKWVQFDDEDMIPRSEDDILKLCGGGDWHISYLLLYKAETC